MKACAEGGLIMRLLALASLVAARREPRLVRGLHPRVYELHAARGWLDPRELAALADELLNATTTAAAAAERARAPRDLVAGHIDDSVGERWWFTDDLVDVDCTEYFRSDPCFSPGSSEDWGHYGTRDEVATLRAAREGYARACATCYFDYAEWDEYDHEEQYFADCQSCLGGDTLVVAWTDCLGFCVADADLASAVALGFATLETAECWLLAKCYDDETVVGLPFDGTVDPFFDDDRRRDDDGGGAGGGLVAVILVAVAGGLCCVSGWVCEGAAWCRGESRQARADEIRIGRPVLLKTATEWEARAAPRASEWEARFPGGHLAVSAPARAGL